MGFWINWMWFGAINNTKLGGKKGRKWTARKRFFFDKEIDLKGNNWLSHVRSSKELEFRMPVFSIFFFFLITKFTPFFSFSFFSLWALVSFSFFSFSFFLLHYFRSFAAILYLLMCWTWIKLLINVFNTQTVCVSQMSKYDILLF